MFVVRASTVATALKKVKIIYPRFAIILIKRMMMMMMMMMMMIIIIITLPKNSSAMAQTTPKIRSFSLANVSAELSLKKTVFFQEKEKLNMLTQ